ncbi:MAG: YvcK family protein, partial [Tissierellales bacterium]
IERIPEETLDKYFKDGARPVIITEKEENILSGMKIKVIKNNLIDIKKNYIRHDAISLSEIILDLMNKEKKN